MMDLAAKTHVFTSLSLVMPYAGTATALDPPGRVEGFDISTSAFETFGVQPMLGAVNSRRLRLWLVAAFAAVGFALALLGVYGIVACMVEERRRELGVRVALGASIASIHRLVVGHGLRLVAAGLILGVSGAFALRRGIEAQLFSVTATNAPALFGVAIALLLGAALPCFIVSRRATRLDPVSALRSE